MKRTITFLFLAVSLMIGCNPITVSPTTQVSSLDGTPVATSTMKPVFTSSITTLVSSPTLVSTSTPGFGMTVSCLEVMDGEIPLENIATGTVVQGRGFFGRLTLRELHTGFDYEVPPISGNVFYYRGDISPDMNLLATSDTLQNATGQFEKMMLSILNARAEVLEKITFNMLGLSNLRWLDNQNIMLYTDQTPKDGTVMVFNPFTREQRYISNNLPDFYVDSSLRPGLSWLIEYSPNLEWGVYLGSVEAEKLGFIVRDFTLGQTVWQMTDFIGEYQKPIWSPNGDEVAVVASGHLYLINRNGQAQPILGENQQSQVSQAAWSPDGRYIAFWNVYSDSLMLYDSQGDSVHDLCIKGDHLSPLIWSADSRQFAIPGNAGESPVLIDVQENKAYKLKAMPEMVYPRGWMNSIP